MLQDLAGGLTLGEEGVGLAEGDELLHQVVHPHLEAARDQGIPVEVVDLVGGIIGVVVALLGAQELLARQHEGRALAQEDDLLAEPVHGEALLVGGLGVGGQELVPDGVVVVAGHIVDDHIRGGPAHGAVALRAQDAEDHHFGCAVVGLAVDVALILGVEDAALQAVADGVVEDRHGADALAAGNNLGNIGLSGLEFRAQRGAAAGPALAVEDRLGVDGVDRLLDGLHGLDIVQGHEIEAEAVDVVLLRPVGHGVHHVLAEHDPLGGRLVAAAGAVGGGAGGVVAVVVIGYDLVQAGVDVKGVVVDHVHDHAHAVLMQGLDHLLELVDPDLAPVGIHGVGALGGVVVLGVVAPVELRRVLGFVHGGVVVDGLEVDVGDPQVPEIVHADGHAGGVGQAALGKGQVLAREPASRNAVGEVADVDLPDDGLVVGVDVLEVFVLVKARGVRLRQVDDHAPVAVDAHCPGVGVHGLLGPGGGGYGVGVVGPVTAVGGNGPDALLAPGHVELLIGVSAAAELIEVQHHGARGGSPDLEGGGLAVEDRAQVVAAVGVKGLEGRGVEDLGGNRVLLLEALQLHGVSLGEVQLLVQGDVALNRFLVETGQALHGDLPVAVEDLDLIQGAEAGGGGDVAADHAQIRDLRQSEFVSLTQGLPSVRTDVLGAVSRQQIDLGVLAGDLGVAVRLKVLLGFAPACAAGIGAVLADDEAHLGNVLGDVQDHLDAVVAGVEEIAPAIGVGIPDPHIALGIVHVFGLPVEGELVGAGFPLQGVLLGDGRRVGDGGRVGDSGRAGCRGGVLHPRPVQRPVAGRKEAHKHQETQKESEAAFHDSHLLWCKFGKPVFYYTGFCGVCL